MRLSPVDRLLSWLYTWRFYGPRCPDFEADCPCCSAWKDHDWLFNNTFQDDEEEGA